MKGGMIIGPPEPGSQQTAQGRAEPPDGWDERWRRLWQHEMAAVSEGLCPAHQVPLEPLASPAGRVTGHCVPCRKFWGANLDSQEVGWWLDHDSRTGEPSARVPDFMAWRADP